jgi:hypothetical protein
MALKYIPRLIFASVSGKISRNEHVLKILYENILP